MVGAEGAAAEAPGVIAGERTAPGSGPRVGSVLLVGGVRVGDCAFVAWTAAGADSGVGVDELSPSTKTNLLFCDSEAKSRA